MQYTFRQGPDIMINVPVTEDDPDLMGDEIETKLAVVFAKAERSAAVQAELNARGTAAGILGARTVSTASGGASEGAARDPMAPVCACGESMKFKEGTSKSSGKPYKGYFCVNNRCSPEFRK